MSLTEENIGGPIVSISTPQGVMPGIDLVSPVQDPIETLSPEERAAQRIKELRTRIDEIDESILKLIAERIGATAEVGEIKRKTGGMVRVASRENQLLNNLYREARSRGIGSNVVNAIWSDVLLPASREQQLQIRKTARAAVADNVEVAY